jgi:hypothetical protein
MIKVQHAFFLTAVMFLITCCCDDNYDWKKVEPGVLKILSLDDDSSKIIIDTIVGNNYSTKTYKVIPRGGSTYSWLSSSSHLIITQRNDRPYIVDVKAISNVDTLVWLKVSETTWGGKVASPDSMQLFIIGFCPFNLSDLLQNGSFKSKMSGYAPYFTTISAIGSDTLVNHNFFNTRWTLKYLINKGYEQSISVVPNQKFEYNGEYVTVKGNGTYNTCKSQIIVNFAVCYLYGDTIEYGSGIDSLSLSSK